jgi:hypothetical protein
MDKPTTAAGYRRDRVDLVRATCLYVATKLGDLADDVVVVGGLAPSLLVDQDAPSAEPHAGTMDLDLGLALAILDDGRYQKLADRLRRAGFAMDLNEEGNRTRQRWRIEGEESATVDFLIQPSRPDDRPGKLRSIEADFAAVIAPGLHLAFQDRRRIALSGETIVGEKSKRDVWVCGAGAFVALKALAFEQRGENKDAYDLFYVMRYYGAGVEEVARSFRPFADDVDALRAVEIVRRDFTTRDGVGARRVAEFLSAGPDEAVQADVVGFAREFLLALEQTA